MRPVPVKISTHFHFKFGAIVEHVQPGILEDLPYRVRHLFFDATPQMQAGKVLATLAEIVDGRSAVIGFGQAMIRSLGGEIPAMRAFPSFPGQLVDLPATPAAMWCWLRGDDRGELLHAGSRLLRAVSGNLVLSSVVDAFKHGSGRDLTGYEDGTENPAGADAVAAAILQGEGPGLDGSSFAAIQQWEHDFRLFESMSVAEQDNTIGRRRADNKELEQAPVSAHVKRTAQESFEPEAFLLRRSMPWVVAEQAGLMFLAFGRSFDAFEAQLRRMVGAEDGITDALFSFSRPVSGSYYWCPPMSNGKLDFSAVCGSVD